MLQLPRSNMLIDTKFPKASSTDCENSIAAGRQLEDGPAPATGSRPWHHRRNRPDMVDHVRFGLRLAPIGSGQ